jgi:hypothetical protein
LGSSLDGKSFNAGQPHAYVWMRAEKDPGTGVSRRAVMQGLVSLVVGRSLLAHLAAAQALGGPARREVDRWIEELAGLCAGVRSHALSPEQWQERIAALYRRVELADVLRAIAFEKLIDGIAYPENMATVRNVTLSRIAGLPARPAFGHKVFALKRGTAVIPHAHNNMVSAHLVLRGTFHVRTYHRRRDEPGALILEPSIDRSYGPGELLTMSDARDNVHWLVATSAHAFTFDVPVTDLEPGRIYPTPANTWSMIHVDPTGRPAADGTIRAPTLSFEEGIARFGRS